MFDKIKKLLSKSKQQELDAEDMRQRLEAAQKRLDAKDKKEKVFSPKELATQKGEPWVEVINMELDPTDPGNGAFELDWNDLFLAKLVRAGYQGKTDQDIIDNWFKSICRNIILENYEQEQADPEKRQTQPNNRRDLGNGRTEVS